VSSQAAAGLGRLEVVEALYISWKQRLGVVSKCSDTEKINGCRNAAAWVMKKEN
jgi:hypothetical protein